MKISIIMKNRIPIFAIVVILLSLFTFNGFAQSEPFVADSIPIVDNQVLFSYHIPTDMSVEDFYRKSQFFIARELKSHSGSYIENSEDLIVCRVIDYLDIESRFLSVFGMYMTYDLKLAYSNGGCDLTISNIYFMEKSDYESQREKKGRINLKQFPAKMILVDQSYHQLFVKKSSEKITHASINRLNTVVNSLEKLFTSE